MIKWVPYYPPRFGPLIKYSFEVQKDTRYLYVDSLKSWVPPQQPSMSTRHSHFTTSALFNSQRIHRYGVILKVIKFPEIRIHYVVNNTCPGKTTQLLRIRISFTSLASPQTMSSTKVGSQHDKAMPWGQKDRWLAPNIFTAINVMYIR